MLVNVYDKQGKENGKLELNDEIFGQTELKESLIHQVVLAQLANKRQGTKSSLTRAEVSGGGRKPWRQKGTGNARQGSTRAPQWIHGGVVFAPKPRDFSQKVNKTMKQEALKNAISMKVLDNELMIVEDLDLAAAKTKEMVKVLDNFGFNKKTLIVINGEDEKVYLAARNIEGVDVIDSDLLNVYDVISHENCLCTQDAALAINAKYSMEE